jgi:aminopeptidase-like protein
MKTSEKLEHGFLRLPKRSELEQIVEKLFPIPRSILGDGFRESLEQLQGYFNIKFNWVYVDSGTQVLDWIVPKEWKISQAYIETPDGKKIANFCEHNLHVVNYSVGVDKKLPLDELKKHLHTLPNMPTEIPYVASYYNPAWGFCISQNEYESLEEGEYHAYIDAEHVDGQLVYGEVVIPGKSSKEILITSYLCHPQMASHELGGPIALCCLYNMLKETGPHNYTYRFLICPENIGAAAFLHNSGDDVSKVLEAGFVLNCLAHGDEWNLKKSRRGNCLSDSLALNTLLEPNIPLQVIDFFPDGSDERQFCSPGFNWPISLVMRKMYGRFPEYHTSADNLEFIDYQALMDSIYVHFKICMTAEMNFIPIGRVLRGSPMLSRSSVDLYPKLMNFGSQPKSETTRFILCVLNESDGSKSLLQIAEKYKFSLIEHAQAIENLLEAQLIKPLSGASSN